MFITLSLQLFKTFSVSQHLANPGFNAPENSGLPQTIMCNLQEDDHNKLKKYFFCNRDIH